MATTIKIQDNQEVPTRFTVDFDNVYLEATGKKILKGVSGSAKPGQLLAIMGASGSGKSSLLNCLAHRGIGMTHNGDVSYSGWNWSKAMKRRLAFVEQQDILWEPFTVREELRTLARLRLPAHMTYDEKMARVEETIDVMGLAQVGDSKIQVISGGEKRRVAIGKELLSDPNVLFLDEPTSGLDSSTALTVMKKVKEIADSGMTVVCVIHQPSFQIFNLIDQLILLSEGEVMYNGAAKDAVDYFLGHGMEDPGEFAAPDYVIDLIQAKKLDAIAKTIRADFGPTRGPTPPTKRHTIDEPAGARYTTGYCTQMRILCGRWWALEEYPNIQSYVLQFGMIFLLCCLFVDIQPKEHDEQRYLSFCFMLAMFAAMGSMYTVFNVFNEDEAKVKKELACGAYRLSTYYSSRTLMKIPVLVGWPLLMASVIFWVSGIDRNLGKYMLFLIINFSIIVVIQSFGWAIGAVCSMQNAMVAFPLLAIYMFLFSDFFGEVPTWLRWMKYGNVLKFIIELTVMIVLHGIKLAPEKRVGEGFNAEWISDPSRSPINLVKKYTKYSPWVCVLYMVCTLIIVRTIAYFGLRWRFAVDDEGTPTPITPEDATSGEGSAEEPEKLTTVVEIA